MLKRQLIPHASQTLKQVVFVQHLCPKVSRGNKESICLHPAEPHFQLGYSRQRYNSPFCLTWSICTGNATEFTILHRNEGSACCISHRAGSNLKIEQLSKSYRLILASTDLTPPRLFRRTTRQEKTAITLTKADGKTQEKRSGKGKKLNCQQNLNQKNGLYISKQRVS